MKQINYLILVLLACLMLSCNKENKNYHYEYEREDVIKIPIENLKTDPSMMSGFDYCIIDGIETIIVYFEDNKLAFFDVKKKELYHEITLPDRRLESFEYINKDSILLLFGYPKNFDEIDHFNGLSMLDTAKLVLMDYNGNYKKYYHFNCKQSNFDNTNFTIDQILPPFTHFLFYERIKRVGDKIFFFPHQHGYWDFENVENNPLIAYYDLTTEKFVFSKNVKLPYTNSKMSYVTNFNVLNFDISANGMPLLRFFYSSDVFEWDYINDTLIKHSFKSQLIDTTTNSIGNLDAAYSGIYYDKYNELYYSYLNFSETTYGENSGWSFIIADKNFNYINELYSPLFGSQPKFFDNKMIFYQGAEDTIYIVRGKLVKKTGDYQKETLSTISMLEKTKH
ncbi:DUF4221 domain-containing protein [Bacteroidales bacterium OttesenSCG-928-I21]|nr:DUF4221 domain-containing protein [Bacteroidales bacterium OttesenSCG-928-I21]